MEQSNLDGFSNYYYDLTESKLFKLKTKKEISITKNGTRAYAKMKRDSGIWVSLSLAKIEALALGNIDHPAGFVQVPNYPTTFVNKYGECWIRPSRCFPKGKYVIPVYPKDDIHYPYINIEGRPVHVHQLLALTYLDKDYIDKGLVCMHIDDNKCNFDLSNLKIGTYSDNNKASYASGRNPGNGLNT